MASCVALAAALSGLALQLNPPPLRQPLRNAPDGGPVQFSTAHESLARPPQVADAERDADKQKLLK